MILLVSFVVMWLAARTGVYVQRKRRKIDDAEREDLAIILGATLTLLALLIGFCFSSLATVRIPLTRKRSIWTEKSPVH